MVSYGRTVEVDPGGQGAVLVLDLGEVRGDVTAQLTAAIHELEAIVRGTLAGYLGDTSPTPAVGRGQARQALLGSCVAAA